MDGSSPLHAAIEAGHDTVLKLLLEGKADVNMLRNDGCTPLFITCSYLRVDVCNHLLGRRDVCVSGTTRLGETCHSVCGKYVYDRNKVPVVCMLQESLQNVMHAEEKGIEAYFRTKEREVLTNAMLDFIAPKLEGYLSATLEEHVDRQI